MAKSNHIHKYKKIKLGKDRSYLVYKCIKPGCSHYIPLVQALNAICECSKCGNLMVIGKAQLYGSGGRAMTNPHCVDCIIIFVKTNCIFV